MVTASCSHKVRDTNFHCYGNCYQAVIVVVVVVVVTIPLNVSYCKQYPSIYQVQNCASFSQNWFVSLILLIRSKWQSTYLTVARWPTSSMMSPSGTLSGEHYW